MIGLAANKANSAPIELELELWPSLAIFVSIWLPFRLLQGGCWARNKLSRAGGWLGGWGGIGNKAQLRPAKAGAEAWPELCNICQSIPISSTSPRLSFLKFCRCHELIDSTLR